jgi:hypothetical protein
VRRLVALERGSAPQRLRPNGLSTIHRRGICSLMLMAIRGHLGQFRWLTYRTRLLYGLIASRSAASQWNWNFVPDLCLDRDSNSAQSTYIFALNCSPIRQNDCHLPSHEMRNQCRHILLNPCGAYISRKFVEFGSPHRPTGGVLSSEGGKTIRDFSRRSLSHVI